MTLTEQLNRYFGFSTFKGDQEAVIRNLLAGNDTFVLMPTGGGKSLCYQLPALMMEGTAIVISPLIALMKNQVDAIRQVSADDGIAHFMNSSLNKAALDEVKADVLAGHTKLLYVAPESLTKLENVDFLQQVKISFYAVDEAHCISEWGHDFRPEYRRIRSIINTIGQAPVIALTATATEKVKTDIKKTLDIPDAKEYISSFNRPNLYYEVRPKTTEVDREIAKFILENPGKSGIIYCLSRKKVEELAETLRANGINARAYHAGMDTITRTETQDAFIMEDIDIIVATIAFGMGIDKPDVRFVIHYDIPKSLEGYYQETGRAGRDGGEGKCIAFYTYRDLKKLEKFMIGKPIAEQDIGRQLLQETASYAESSVCRRRVLLHYFGEEYDKDNCGNCDNCLHPKARTEAMDDLKLVLETVKAVKENFKVNHLINVLVGNATEEVLSHKHDDLDLFGEGDDKEPHYWQAIVRQAILANYLRKEVETYGLLKLTPSGKDFIKHPVPFYMTEDNDFTSGVADEEGGSSALDPELLGILKQLRKKVAHDKGIPPYTVFKDSSLDDMASRYPINEVELKNITGVGEGTVRRYGAIFCQVIKDYCDEYEIERPADFFKMRSVVKKSKTKVDIIQAIDRKVDLDILAESKGLDFDALLDEMDAIVDSGTKLNIDYYLNEDLDPDQIEEVFQYFRESNTDNLRAAIEEFEDEYTDQQIRLIRIKFISDIAN